MRDITFTAVPPSLATPLTVLHIKQLTYVIAFWRSHSLRFTDFTATGTYVRGNCRGHLSIDAARVNVTFITVTHSLINTTLLRVHTAVTRRTLLNALLLRYITWSCAHRAINITWAMQSQKQTEKQTTDARFQFYSLSNLTHTGIPVQLFGRKNVYLWKRSFLTCTAGYTSGVLTQNTRSSSLQY